MPQIDFEPATSYEDALARAAEECGIQSEYWDIFHKKHEISLDIRRRLLQALGWDVSTLETLDNERRRRFQRRTTQALPQTLVISASDPAVPLTLDSSSQGTIHFELQFEDGETLGGTVETNRLCRTCDLRDAGRSWSTYELRLPVEIPLGYHHLTVTLNEETIARSHVIVCPNHAYLPESLSRGGRAAGFNVALYGLRSSRNWGCGDFTDLRALAEWARREVGFSFIGLNPLHALHNRAPYNTSPYLPLSIFYKNLIYIDVQNVPEFQQSRCAQELFRSPAVQKELQKLRAAEFVAYQAVDRLKRCFLKILFRDFARQRKRHGERAAAFSAYCEREGDLLEKFALYCALDELLHKQDRRRWTWQQWPPEYQDPESEACRKFAKQHARTVEFYKYIQFVIDEQLSAAQEHAKQCGMEIGLYHDLAVATDSCGSDLWAYRDFYVNGCRVGAPPDDFSPNGQDWAFPPPNKLAHRENGYRLYRESIRKIMCHGGALRIDHVMRLFRLYWIPDGVSARDGSYVRDNAIDLIRILALESVRTRSIVIGEDLGTVTDEIRDTLARFGILSYRLFYFERRPQDRAFKRTEEYPRQALVASTTHDLPTIVGFWTFSDIEARRRAGLIDEAAYRAQIEDRRREKQRMLDALHAENLLPHYYPRDSTQVGEVDGVLHNAIIGFLAQVPSMILLVNEGDLTKETHQQNLPGSTAEYPNWQRKMNVKIEDLNSDAWKPYTDMLRDQLTRTGRRGY